MGSVSRIIDVDADRRVWANAGGTVDFDTGKYASQIARIDELSRPTMLALQFGRKFEGANLGAGVKFDIFATIDWESGRGTHTAEVDIGRGTTVVLAAADCVDVKVAVQNYADDGTSTPFSSGTTGKAGSVSVTIAPCYAPNPVQYPPTRTQHFFVTAGQKLLSAVSPPNFARRVRFLATNAEGSPERLASCQLMWNINPTHGDAGVFQELETGVSFDMVNGCDSFKLYNNGASDVEIFAIWELAL